MNVCVCATRRRSYSPKPIWLKEDASAEGNATQPKLRLLYLMSPRAKRSGSVFRERLSLRDEHRPTIHGGYVEPVEPTSVLASVKVVVWCEHVGDSLGSWTRVGMYA